MRKLCHNRLKRFFDLAYHPPGREGESYELIYPHFEECYDCIFAHVAREDEDMGMCCSGANLFYCLRTVHEHPFIVGEDYVKMGVTALLEECFASMCLTYICRNIGYDTAQ